MIIDNKKSTNLKHTGLESFFPLFIEKKSSFTTSLSKTTTTTILIRRRSPTSDIWIVIVVPGPVTNGIWKSIHVDRM